MYDVAARKFVRVHNYGKGEVETREVLEETEDGFIIRYPEDPTTYGLPLPDRGWLSKTDPTIISVFTE